MLYLTLRLLHISFMAIWIGAIFFCSGDVRRTLAAPDSDLDLLRDRMNRATRLGGASGLITVITGIALIFVLGGFGSVTPAIHTGLLLGLVMLGVGGGMVGRNWRKIDAALAGGATRESVAPLVKKLVIGNGVFHALWTLTVVLMVFRAVLA